MRSPPNSCLPALCQELGEWSADSDVEPALESRDGDDSVLARIGGIARIWRRTTGVPAPIVASVTG